MQDRSPYEAFDRAARNVAEHMELEPALNRDDPVGVWVARRITFRVRR